MNQLYDFEWINKGIKNVDAVARKLEPALKRATNYRLEIASEERQKKKKMMRISLSSKEKKVYESDTVDKMVLDQANDKYLLQL